MIIYTMSILMLPLIFLVWAVDVYLFLAALRLILPLFAAPWANRVCKGLGPLVDPVPNAIRRWLARRKDDPGPAWLPWAITLGGSIVLKHLILSLIV